MLKILLLIFSLNIYASEIRECLSRVVAGPDSVLFHQNEELSRWNHLLGRDDRSIRKWYLDQVNVEKLTALNEFWTFQKIDKRDRAWRHYMIRHNSRMIARAFMMDALKVKALRARDLELYGNADGPDFSYFISHGKKRGLTLDKTYDEIISSSSRTNADVNESLDLTP